MKKEWINDHLPIDRVPKAAPSPSNPRAKAGFARWGNDQAIEERRLVSVSKSVVEQFHAIVPPEDRREAADRGIRYAIRVFKAKGARPSR